MTTNALNIIPTKTDSCPAMDRVASSKKMTVSWGKHKFGDIILFDFNKNGTADHTGIVIGTGGNNLYTVEGNTGSGSNTNGGQVQARTRTKSTVKRFVRPKYTKDITPAMIVYTALGEVGVKESPKNSNKVKYNQWFYGKNTSAYWCMTYVCWLFAHAETIPKVNKPSGVYHGAIPEQLIKYGSSGDKINKLQAFLNWYHVGWKLAVDGDFGPKTMRALLVYQNTEGLEVDGVYGPKSAARAKTYTKAKKTTTTTTTPAATTTTKKTTTVKAETRKKMSKIGHARKDYDHKAGDSSGKEVCKTAFTYKTSNTSVYNWTYVFRPKDIAKANKAASMCEKAIANNNIGYCSKGETKYGKDRAMTKLAKKANYDLSKIEVKCGCSCGDLICLCNQYAGLSKCYIGSGKQLAAKYKKNKNFECIPYKKGIQLYRGDVLITAHSNGKNNHVVMCL